MIEGSFGRYSVSGGPIGRGAMGVVYRAHDSALDRDVAIKELVLPADLSGRAREDVIARFYREGRAAGRLAHPSIVTVHDVGEIDGHIYLAMELLDGPTLGDVLASGPMDPMSAYSVLLQVAEALEAAHAAGVVHRDIKPDNCFWLPDGRVKVVDFGIARVSSEATRTQAGTIMGTPGYMAPEQVRGLQVTAAADIFSWGAVAYECLAGHPPFGSDDASAVMYRIVNEDPADLRSLAPDAPVSLVAIIAKALARDARDRYQDASELVEDLRSGAVPSYVPRAPGATVEPRASSIPPWAPARAEPDGGNRGLLIGGSVAAVVALVGVIAIVAALARPGGAPDLAAGSFSPRPAFTAAPDPGGASPEGTSPQDPVVSSQPFWTIFVHSAKNSGEAQRFADGLPGWANADVLRTNDYSSLRSGWYSVYLGEFPSEAAVRRFCGQAVRLVPGAYYKCVGDNGSCPGSVSAYWLCSNA